MLGRKGANQPVSVEYLLAHAAYHESLLQQYRGLALNSASILAALGTGLAVTILVIDDSLVACVLAAIMLLVACFAVASLRAFSEVIRSRGDAVSYWLNQLVGAERLLPSSQRYYTRFQLERRHEVLGLPAVDPGFALDTLTDEQRSLLVGRQGGYARRVIDSWLGFGVTGLWLVLVVVVLVSLLARWGHLSP